MSSMSPGRMSPVPSPTSADPTPICSGVFGGVASAAMPIAQNMSAAMSDLGMYTGSLIRA